MTDSEKALLAFLCKHPVIYYAYSDMEDIMGEVLTGAKMAFLIRTGVFKAIGRYIGRAIKHAVLLFIKLLEFDNLVCYINERRRRLRLMETHRYRYNSECRRV